MPSETPVSENVLSPDRPAEEPLAGEVAVDPTTGRPAGRAQALVLLLSSCLAVLGAVLLAPVLPRIQDAFADTPGVEALVIRGISRAVVAIRLFRARAQLRKLLKVSRGGPHEKR